MQTYFNDNPREFEELPKDGEVFGLHLEGYMFRAVKENGDVSVNPCIKSRRVVQFPSELQTFL